MSQNTNKPILSFPYHDPAGKFNDYIRQSLPRLKEIFSHICISATPSTYEINKEFVDFLEKEGCLVYRNVENSSIGDHYRNALQLAVDIEGDNKIFFSFIDRLVYILNTDVLDQFTEDMQTNFIDVVLYERSEKAWQTHPANYREIEQTVNKLGSFLIGEEVELGTCGFSIYSDIARQILPQSIADSYSAGTEWILLIYLLGIKPAIIKVDWLSWEDPFVEKISPQQLKVEREQDRNEYIKRLEMNIPFINLLVQKRFYGLLK